MADFDSFVATYRRHVAAVRAGDMTTVLADMDPDAMPQVLTGVTVPRSRVLSYEVLSTRLEDGVAIGACRYETPDGPIGLRSTWRWADGSWLAYALENVP